MKSTILKKTARIILYIVMFFLWFLLLYIIGGFDLMQEINNSLGDIGALIAISIYLLPLVFLIEYLESDDRTALMNEVKNKFSNLFVGSCSCCSVVLIIILVLGVLFILVQLIKFFWYI
jgi:hypothetical protein